MVSTRLGVLDVGSNTVQLLLVDAREWFRSDPPPRCRDARAARPAAGDLPVGALREGVIFRRLNAIGGAVAEGPG